MKKNLFTGFALLSILFSGKAQELNSPESPAYHAKTKSYYVSNIKSNIINQVDHNNKVTTFYDLQGISIGLTISKDVIYVITEENIAGIDIATKKQVFHIAIDGAEQLNDITADDKGNLYVTDRLANIIYKIDINKKSYSTLVQKDEIITPNGIVFDKKSGSLLTCTTVENGIIYKINPDNGTIIEKHRTAFSNLDGISADNNGNIYVTSWSLDWKTSKLVKFTSNFKSKELVVNTNGMGDIEYNSSTNKIVVANMFTNNLDYIKVN